LSGAVKNAGCLCAVFAQRWVLSPLALQFSPHETRCLGVPIKRRFILGFVSVWAQLSSRNPFSESIANKFIVFLSRSLGIRPRILRPSCRRTRGRINARRMGRRICSAEVARHLLSSLTLILGHGMLRQSRQGPGQSAGHLVGCYLVENGDT
jgi:hypothetical protein